MAIEAAGGIVLLAATMVALIWANSAWSASYARVWQTEIAIRVGDIGLAKSVTFWINDGLMTVFIFVIGLEIKRELLVGELASWRQAALPIAAAAGGVIVPAAIFAAVTLGRPGANGWGVPMATDTAFALAILTLLGARAPVTLTIFLTALAIFDDISALAVIAVFYTERIVWIGVAVSGGILGLLAVANWLGARHSAVYGLLGVGLWLALYHAGVHPTLAGILLAIAVPAWSRIGTHQFLRQARDTLHRFEAAGSSRESVFGNSNRQDAFLELSAVAERAETPLQRLEHQLHPLAVFAIMPVFALANAGLPLGSDAVGGLVSPVGLGIVLGLGVGKPAGILIGSWVAVRLGLTSLPHPLGWRHILGVGCLGGIGFTMSIFIADLAFADAALLHEAKVGVFAASILSGLLGWRLLRTATWDGQCSSAEPEISDSTRRHEQELVAEEPCVRDGANLAPRVGERPSFVPSPGPVTTATRTAPHASTFLR